MMRVVVITGASDGIGAELARQWAARHAANTALVLAARQVDKLDALAAKWAPPSVRAWRSSAAMSASRLLQGTRRGRHGSVRSHRHPSAVFHAMRYLWKFAMTGFFEAWRVELMGTGVGVMIAYPGGVATGIRLRGYNADGQPAGRSGLDERGAMTVEDCARLIINGVDARRRDIIMSAKGKLARWLKLVAPGHVDRLALKALNQDVRR